MRTACALTVFAGSLPLGGGGGVCQPGGGGGSSLQGWQTPQYDHVTSDAFWEEADAPCGQSEWRKKPG